MTVDTLLTSPVIQLTPHLSHLPFLMENVDWALCLQFLFCQHLCRAAKPCSNVSWLSRLPCPHSMVNLLPQEPLEEPLSGTQRRRCRSHRSKREPSPVLSPQLCLPISPSDVLLLFHYCSFCLPVLSTALAFDYTISHHQEYFICLPSSSLPPDPLCAPAPPRHVFPAQVMAFLVAGLQI